MVTLVSPDTRRMPTRITFGPPLPSGVDAAGGRIGRMIHLDNGDYILVEEELQLVAARLSSSDRLVQLTRLWGRKQEHVYVNPSHVRHLTRYDAPGTEAASAAAAAAPGTASESTADAVVNSDGAAPPALA
jgi:hypothetical protein